MKCPAPAREDRFPQVPTVGARDLSELQQLPRLGQGSYASVYQVELPLVGPCAFKKLEGMVDRATLREAASMWQLRHSEHIVRVLMVCDELGQLGLVLELVEGGSLGALLHERKERLAEAEMLQILHDVATGLECVHAHKQVHLDVKSDNVLLTRQLRAKLSDFGSSKEKRNTHRETLVRVTRQWSAPETIADVPKIAPACDIWSFGMLVWEMLTGRVPHDNVPERDLLSRIAKGGTPSVEGIDERFAAILQKYWQVDPTKRSSATELVAEIGALMRRDCCSCFSPFPLTSGVTCSVEEAFLCNGCVTEAMTSALKSGSAWRSDGALVLGRSHFELSRIRHAVGKELFEQWQTAQLRAKEKEVTESLKAAMEGERGRWNEMGAAERAAAAILNEVLPFSCPNCKGKLDYDKGCMAMYHREDQGGCGARFCEGIFADAHGHVETCKANTLKLPWYPDEAQAEAVFARVQRERQIRQLRAEFQRMESGLRDAVFERVRGALRELDIAREDVQGK